MDLTLLVADPEQETAELLRLVLESDGYRVVVADSVEAAVAILRQGRVSAVVSDDFTAAPASRLTHSVAPLLAAAGTTPVVLMTTTQLPPDRQPRDYGVAALLPKPFELDELSALVARMVSPLRTNGPGARSSAPAP